MKRKQIGRIMPLAETRHLESVANSVWRGVIKRLRIYNQPETTGNKVFAYLDPGHNANYIGHSADPNVIHALFLACDNGRPVMGYTNSKFEIEWMDYGGG